MIEIFALCLFVSKLSFDLCFFFFKRPYLILMFAILLNGITVTSGLLRLADFNAVSIADIPQHFPLPEPPAIVSFRIITETHFVKCHILGITEFQTLFIMGNGDIVDVQVWC